MVWHDHIFRNTGNRTDIFLNNCANSRQFCAGGDVGIAPYDAAEDTLPVFCADRNKIGSWLAVAIFCQPIAFSFRVQDYIKGSMPRTGWPFSVSQLSSSSQSVVMVSSAM